MCANQNKKVPKTAAKRSDTIVAKIIKEFKDTTRAEIRKWRQALSGGNAKTLKDVETALFNIQDAMKRTEEYVREHQA